MQGLVIPSIGQHCAIFGQTGSGKTELARRLVNQKTHVVVLDTKRETKWDDVPELGYQATDSINGLYKLQENPRLIFRPTYKDKSERFAEYNEFFKFCFLRRNCLIYVDEGFKVCDGNYIPDWWGRCLTEGRQLNISCYTASQRPVSISQLIISEATYVFSFHLQLPQDRAKLQECFGYSLEFLADVPQYHFYQINQSREFGVRGAFKLKL